MEEWRKDVVKSGGGVLLNLGIHLLEIVLWLLPKKIAGVSASMHKSDGVEDSGVAILRFQGGTFITLEVAYTLLMEKDFTYLNLFGEKGSALLNPLKIKKIKNEQLEDITPQFSRNKIYKSSFQLQAEWFIDVINNKKKPASGWKDALELSKIIDALYRSAENKEEIKLD